MKKSLIFFIVFICAASAVSQILTFEFSGSVSSIDNGGSTSTVPGVSPGQPIAGWFSYDDSVAGVIDPSQSDRYNYDQIGSVQINIGDVLFSHLNEFVEIDVDNDSYDVRTEGYEDRFFYRFTTTVSEFGTDDIGCFVRFDEFTASAFESFALPTSFDLSEFDMAEFYFYRSIEMFQVSCQIDEISLIPEPGTMCFVALGGMLLRRRKA